MSTSKLIKKLSKLKTKIKNGDHKAPTRSSATPSASAPTPPAPQQLPCRLSTPSNNNNNTSTFLSLPGEIRNQIYTYATYPSLATISIHHRPSILFSLPIFHICHQIRVEAISHFCATKAFYFDGVALANEFFNIIGASAVRDLRDVTIRDRGWSTQGVGVESAREALLAWLMLATSLRRFEYVVGRFPINVDEEWDLQSVSSAGVKWIFQIRDVVDGEDLAEAEECLGEKFGRLCVDVGKDQAVAFLQEQLARENDMREAKVFWLHKVVSLEGKTKEIRLPCRVPGFLKSTH